MFSQVGLVRIEIANFQVRLAVIEIYFSQVGVVKTEISNSQVRLADISFSSWISKN